MSLEVPMIPESAPFTPSQRAWLNGFFAGLLNVDPADLPASSDLRSATSTTGAIGSSGAVAAPSVDEADTPWHDPALPMSERLKLADARPLADKLMASMAQLDCGACGYMCRTYSNALADGSEKDAAKCVPGGTDTARMLKKIMKEAGPVTPAVSSVKPSPVTTSSPAAAPGKFDRNNPYLATVLTVKPLTRPGSDKDTRFVAIDITGSGLKYEAGDALGVYPRNCYEQVNALIRLLSLSGAEPVTTRAGRATTLRLALIEDCDIDRPRDELYELLAACATDPQHAAMLKALASGEPAAGLMDDPRVIDVLARFPSARPGPGDLVKTLPVLLPRLYSISSSPRKFPDEIHLTVGVVRYTQHGENRKGVASTFLAERVQPHEPVRVFVHHSHFRLPASGDTPVIMVGPGTGIAPFRAFLQDRDAAAAKGPNWLFFGDQRSATDFLYDAELRRYLDEGLLTRLDTAFSRDQAEKIYVQHRMLQHAEELFAWLQKGGHFYVCGDAKRMAKDVDETLQRIVAEQGAMSPEKAKAWLTDLQQNGRYQRDVY